MVEANNPVEVERLKQQIIHGFYGGLPHARV
jgi:hypothetical protein